MFRSPRTPMFLLMLLALAFSGVSGCAVDSRDDLAMMPLEQLPPEVQTSAVVVQQAYQFAAANPEVMRQIACYCGCGDIGHTSNYSCYVAGQRSEGTLEFDNHALGCSICVDITLDVMRLRRQGRSVFEIRAYVDDTYSRYGPSNIP